MTELEKHEVCLGMWVLNQKLAYKEGELSSDKIKALESLRNWSWEMTEFEEEIARAWEVDDTDEEYSKQVFKLMGLALKASDNEIKNAIEMCEAMIEREESND